MRGLAIVAILAMLWPCPAALVAQDERSILKRVDRLLEAGRVAAPDVWPGFRIPAEVILCSRSGLTLVRLEHRADPPWVTGNTEEVSPRSYLVSSPPTGLEHVCFDLEYSLGGSELVAVPLISSVYTLDDPILANLVQFYHEAFHRYQQLHFQPTRGSGLQPLQEVQLPLEVLNEDGFARLAREERHELARALSAEGPDSKRAAIERYIQLREQRLAHDKRIGDAEAHHERKEGVAHLVGLEAAFRVAERDEDAVRKAVLDHLRNTPAFLGEEHMAHPYRRWHVYGAGAALALLLTDFGVSWREMVTAGETPYSLVVREVGGREAEAAHGG